MMQSSRLLLQFSSKIHLVGLGNNPMVGATVAVAVAVAQALAK